MAWVIQDKGRRVIALILIVAAFLGPWAFDQINVPAQYTCSPPHVRLDGDFCGLPLSGVWILSTIAEYFTGFAAATIKGEIGLSGGLQELLFVALLSTLVLPALTTIGRMLRPRSRRWRLFNLAGWSLGLVVAGFFAVVGGLDSGRGLRYLWGLWLYIGLAAVMVIAEARPSRPTD